MTADVPPEALSEPARGQCPNCRKGLPSDARLCDGCGHNLTRSMGRRHTESELNVPEAPASQPALSGPIPEAEVVFHIGDQTHELVVGPDAPAAVGREFRPDEEGYSPFGHLLEGRFPRVSRRHAEFEISDGRLFVRDVESTHGTFVNGEQLIPNRPRPLVEGDHVRFGPNLTALVRLRQSP